MGATASNARKGKARKNTGQRYEEGFLGFVDIPLSDHDRDEITVMLGQGSLDGMEFIERALEDGYKFSLSNDSAHSMYIATLTGKADGCENRGYALSGRGPDAVQAVLVLWYKHEVLAHLGKWSDQGTGPEDRQLPMWS